MIPDTVTTVILIRHADRDLPPDGTPDLPGPSLNQKGLTRAFELIHVLSTPGIQAVYRSQYRRSKMTAKPFLAKHPEIPMIELHDAPDIKDHILTHHAGGTVLVVGHADTVPALITLLGGPSLAVINDCVFDNLFVLVKHSIITRSSLTRLKYGEPTAPC